MTTNIVKTRSSYYSDNKRYRRSSALRKILSVAAVIIVIALIIGAVSIIRSVRGKKAVRNAMISAKNYYSDIYKDEFSDIFGNGGDNSDYSVSATIKSLGDGTAYKMIGLLLKNYTVSFDMKQSADSPAHEISASVNAPDKDPFRLSLYNNGSDYILSLPSFGEKGIIYNSDDSLEIPESLDDSVTGRIVKKAIIASAKIFRIFDVDEHLEDQKTFVSDISGILLKACRDMKIRAERKADPYVNDKGEKCRAYSVSVPSKAVSGALNDILEYVLLDSQLYPYFYDRYYTSLGYTDETQFRNDIGDHISSFISSLSVSPAEALIYVNDDGTLSMIKASGSANYTGPSDSSRDISITLDGDLGSLLSSSLLSIKYTKGTEQYDTDISLNTLFTGSGFTSESLIRSSLDNETLLNSKLEYNRERNAADAALTGLIEHGSKDGKSSYILDTGGSVYRKDDSVVYEADDSKFSFTNTESGLDLTSDIGLVIRSLPSQELDPPSETVPLTEIAPQELEQFTSGGNDWLTSLAIEIFLATR